MFGASSQIGHFLLPSLRRQGVVVHALTRGESRDDVAGVHWHHGELPNRVPAVASPDGILGFGPLDKLARWLSSLPQAPAPVLVATSSMSALSKRDAARDDERELSERLRCSEAGIRDQCQRLGMAWTLIRPTMIYGAGLDRSLAPIARRASRWRLFPLPRGRGLRQPVHAADIAEAAWRALRTPAAHARILELGGGERLEAAEMFARVRGSLPTATLPLPLGRSVLAAIAAIVPRMRGPIDRLAVDLVADNSDVEELLGVWPRAFRPEPATWLARGEPGEAS